MLATKRNNDELSSHDTLTIGRLKVLKDNLNKFMDPPKVTMYGRFKQWNWLVPALESWKEEFIEAYKCDVIVPMGRVNEACLDFKDFSRTKSSVRLNRPFQRRIAFARGLAEIEQEIETAKELSNAGPGWDGENALPISQEIFEKTVTLLLQYFLQIYREYRVLICTPEINPARDGSIDMSWRVNDFRLIINVKKKDDEYLAYYFADQKNTKQFIKGVTDTDSVNESLAIWMKNLQR